LLYAEENTDVTDLVMDKLGIKEPKEGEAKTDDATKSTPAPVKAPTPLKKPIKK